MNSNITKCFIHTKVLRGSGAACMRSQGQTVNVTFNLSLIRAMTCFCMVRNKEVHRFVVGVGRIYS